MKRLIPIALIAGLQVLYADDAGREKWASQLSLLTNGMQRADVEKLFPHVGGMERMMGSGSGYAIIYNIDDDTAISLAYDYTGPQRDADGVATNVYSPSNRLRAVRGLIPQKKSPPIILTNTNRMIEPAARPYGSPAAGSPFGQP